MGQRNITDFYHRFYSNLLNTKAHVVLMTGTPVNSFSILFPDIKNIRVKKTNQTSAKINLIDYEKELNQSSIIETFANNCIDECGKRSLNIIFIKNKDLLCYC